MLAEKKRKEKEEEWNTEEMRERGTIKANKIDKERERERESERKKEKDWERYIIWY